MSGIVRRDLLKGSLGLLAGSGLLAASALKRPALAASTTLTVWWNQGFYPAEDAAFHSLIAAWEKSTGNHIDLTLLPGQALNEKIISALTSGEVPDLMYADNAPAQIVPQNAWHGKLLDLTDVVATQKSELSPTAIQSAQFYNAQEKKRGFYGVPFKGATLNIPVWKSLIEKAGYKVSDMPKNWDAFFDFFKPVQDKLREAGHSPRLRPGLYALHHWRRSQQFIQPVPGRLWRWRDRLVRRPVANQRSQGAQGGDRYAEKPDRSVQGRLRSAQRVELGRSRQQQRLPRQGGRDDAPMTRYRSPSRRWTTRRSTTTRS